MERFVEEGTCPVCLEIYSNPHILTCGHNLCLSCSTTISKATHNPNNNNNNVVNELCCPLCRHTTLERELKPNITLRNMVEMLKQGPVVVERVEKVEKENVDKAKFIHKPGQLLCDICKEKEATTQCQDCQQSALTRLCKRCSDFIHKGVFTSHRIGPCEFDEDFLLKIQFAEHISQEPILEINKKESFRFVNPFVAEIQNILKSHKEYTDDDLMGDIHEFKRNIVAELRKNNVLERDLSILDKRIACLVKYRSNNNNTEAIKESVPQFHLTPKQLKNYQNLFYLLQTEPRYLGRLVTQVQPDKLEQFLNTVLFTLFGDHSPREEFHLLSLFNFVLEQEMTANSNVTALISAESVVQRMITLYNSGKQARECLKHTCAPIVKYVANSVDLYLELSSIQVYQILITDIEIQTGVKSTLNRDLPEATVVSMPDVQAARGANIENCISICNRFFGEITNSVSRLPFVFRWVSKQIHCIAKQKWDASDDNIWKVIGFFAYNRLIEVALVMPDSYDLVNTNTEVSALARRNLRVVAKVLQALFTFHRFQDQGDEKWFLPLNNWITSNTSLVRKYFSDLISVPDPSEHLQVDKYNELILKCGPVITISLSEMIQIHFLILENFRLLQKHKNDPLGVIMKDLTDSDAPPVVGSFESEHKFQLTLVDRFKKEKIEEELSSSMVRSETNELLIRVLREMPQSSNEAESQHATTEARPYDDLISILQRAQQFGLENTHTNITRILANLEQLQATGAIVGSGDNYESFLQAISLDITNRQAIIKQQQKEIDRIFFVLKEIRNYGKYLNDQIAQFHYYLTTVLRQCTPNRPSKPVKFSYKELVKSGVIISSELSEIGQKFTVFIFSVDSPGTFNIEAKMAGRTVDTIMLELDELLERSHSNPILKLENVTLDVNFTLHLLNRHFLCKAK